MFLALFLSGCSSCSGGGGDADTETESESDSEIVFGTTTPCANAARPGELCVPGGNYLMGCVPGDTQCEDNEKPLVMTTLSPFFIDEKEATIADLIEWLNAIKDDPAFIAEPLGWNDGTGNQRIWGTSWNWGVIDQGDYVPIVLRDSDGEYYFNEAANEECPAQGGAAAAAGGFSWLGAKMYCEWKGMQLPTEAQWEAAARGQTERIWPCGSGIGECWQGVYACCTEADACGYAYYENMCHCCAPFDVDVANTCPSPFGVKGMYGNAAEWTADYTSEDHSVCVGGCVDPASPNAPYSDAVHVIKGGSMDVSGQTRLRISIRQENNTDDGSSETGVRCARPDAPFVSPDAGATASDGGNRVHLPVASCRRGHFPSQ